MLGEPHIGSRRRLSARGPVVGGRALEALNFFMADMQAGVGPFLGVFLAAHRWRPGPIGTVMTLGGVAGMIVTAPAGAHQGNPSALVALTIVVAQGVMVLASLVAMRMAARQGYWLVLLITFIALPIRGLIAAGVITWWGVFPVQILDGIGAGLQSVAVPGLVARVLDGTGRVNLGQGVVMTVQGVGASLSPASGGWLAQTLGYPLCFALLGSLSLGSLALWLAFASMLKPACAQVAEGEPHGDLTTDCA